MIPGSSGRAALNGLLVFCLLALAFFARAVFVPLFLALFLAILLEPFVQWMVRIGIGRTEASIAATVTFLCFAVLAGWAIYRSVSGIAGEMPAYSERIRGLLSGMHLPSEEIRKVQVVQNVPVWMHYAASWMGSLYEVVSIGLFVPLLLLYLLFDKENLLESFNALAGRFFYLPKLNSELPKIIRAFVRGNVFTGTILILGHAAVFRLAGLQNWVPLAILTGFLNLVPLVGAPLSLILPFAQGVLQFHEAGPFVAIGLAIVSLHLVTNNLVLPFFMSSRVNVNSVTLVFGLLFWSWLWGAVGFLLAIPMTALVKTLLESNSKTFAISNLFAARPKLVLPGGTLSSRESRSGKTDPRRPVPDP